MRFPPVSSRHTLPLVLPNRFEKVGVESNTIGQVATAISFAALDPARKGTCCLVGHTLVLYL